MLGVIEKQRCISYSIYKGLCKYGTRLSKNNISFHHEHFHQCPTQQQQFSTMFQTTPQSFMLKYLTTSCMLPSRFFHVSTNTWCESDKLAELNEDESRTSATDRLEPINSSDNTRLRRKVRIKQYDKNERKKRQLEADAFVEKRFYNIEKSAKVREISQIKLAREKGELSDIEYEHELEKLEKTLNTQASLKYPGSSYSQSAIVKKGANMRVSNIIWVDQGEPEPIIRSLIKEIDDSNNRSDNHELVPVQYESKNLTSGEPIPFPFPKLYHLAPLVNENTVLRNLVTVGVDLSKVERHGNADSVMKMDFNRDVKPLLLYLHDIGVPGDKVGHVLSKNSSLLVMDLNHLKTRITYLRSKKFKREDIVEMIVKNPKFLYYSTVRLDQTLGFLQKQFWLTGDELRQLVTRAPKVLTMDPAKIQDHVYLFQDEFGFTKREVKKMVLNYASVLKVDLNNLAERFNFLHKNMKIPYSSLIDWPVALRKNLNLIENRHNFLEIQGRAQYNPELPNYVSLKRLLATRDEEFSCDIAKASIAEYNNYLRTV